MEDIGIIYATLSGNSQAVATELGSYLEATYPKVSLFDIQDIEVDQLKEHDIVFFATSTWGEGDLNFMMEMFFSNIEESPSLFAGVTFALISLGDSSYEKFANVGDILEKRFTQMGAIVLGPIIKLDGYPNDEHFKDVNEWASKIVEGMK